MKYIFLLLSGLLLLSCDKLDELTKFEMPYEVTVTVSSSTNIDLPINIITPPISSNAEGTFESNNTSKDLIEEIVLTELTMTVVSPNGEDFSFLKSVSIFINADGLSELEVASSGTIDNSAGSVIMLTTVENNLMEYLKKDAFSLRVNVVTDEIITQDHTIEVDALFFVDAKILGV